MTPGDGVGGSLSEYSDNDTGTPSPCVKNMEDYEMTITVAGEKKEYKDGLTLPELLELENVEMPEYVTVSINEEFVEADKKATTVLKEGDNVEFLYFMGGGC